jgi:fibronectin-binding autotransporter adhesin
MKRSTKKTIGLAVSGVLLAGGFAPRASATTATWTSTGAGSSQDWFTTANWSTGVVPGSADTAFFPVVPTASTVNVGSPASVGAIFAEFPSNNTTPIISGSTLTLFGQTLSVPQAGSTLTSEPNVVLAFGDSTTSAQTNTLTINNNLALENAQNVMVASPNSGLGATGQTINLAGNISNGTGTPAQLTLLGGGTSSLYGATFDLTGTNTFTGGIVVGNAAINQGATLEVTPNSLPSSGTITIDEQSQILLNASGTYGAGTTLNLNGPGVGPGVSTGSSGALRTGKTANATYAGTVNIGTDTSGSAAAPFVVISATGSNTVTFSGQVTGSGSIQKQGGGLLILSGSGNTWNGSLQIGNGAVTANANSAIGTGDLQFAQTSTNTTQVNLFNSAQSIRNLSSSFALTANSDTQVLSLNGTALTINETATNTFGYGAVVGLTSTIADGASAGSVIYHGTPGAQLNLSGPNTYSGGTTISGGILNLANGFNGTTLGVNGSALGSGNVAVNSGGTLSSGDGVSVLGQHVTAGGFTGNLTVNSGGIVAPGGVGAVGSLSVGALTANTGSAFDFDLSGGTSAATDTIDVNGSATLNGTDTINVAGDQIAFTSANAPLQLMSFTGGLGIPATSFVLGTTPNGHNRTYSLTTNSSGVFLNITDKGNERVWSVGGNSPTSATDGAGTWANGSINFFNTDPAMTGTQEPYANTSTDDVIFGSGGNGGIVTLSGAVTVGGELVFSQVNTPYTIGASGGTNALTLGAGIIGSNNATIAAPVILSASQTFTAGAGTTLTLSGGISEQTAGTKLTIGGDIGTVVLGGTNTYTGGTTISQGVLQTSTGSIPTSGTLQNNASLVFSQATNGTYSGQITGTGSVAVANPGTATVTLGNTSNSYSGATNIQSGVLSVGSVGALGTGAGGINFSGGTLQFTAPLTFPVGSPSHVITLLSGTSTIDTDGNDVTLGQDLVGAGNLNKIGGGNLTLTGLIPTTIIGQVGVLGGSLTFDPASGASYGIGASSSPGTFTGDLILQGSLELRLEGGDINGGGNVRVQGNNINIVAEGNTTIDNAIVLNEGNLPSFVTNIGVKATNTLTITSAISGNSDVDFTGGAGITQLFGQSTYTGATTIDNGAAGEVQLDVNNALPTGSNVHINPNGTLDLFGVTQTIGSLDSAAPGSTNAILTNNSTTANSTLIIAGSKSTNFAGFIEDSAGAPVFGGSLTIELGAAYTGTLTLNSSSFNAYFGGTILNGGTLSVANDGLMGDPSGGLTFGGGTLAVTSSFTTNRPITVNPGNSSIDVAPSTSLTINSSAMNWEGGTLNATDTGSVSIAQTGGTVSVTAGSTLAVGSTSSVNVSGSVDPFTDSSNASHHVAVINSGAFNVVDVNSSIAGITGTGALTIGGDGTPNSLQLATNSGLSTQDSVTIAANSSLDLTNNHLIINYAAGTQATVDATIRGYLINGYNGGLWNGTHGANPLTGGGINSSTAAANSAHFGLGYADGADDVVAGLSSGQLEIKYTLLGDANLDGVVSGDDFAILVSNLGKSVAAWDKGDFNYDGVVSGDDFALLVGNLGEAANGADITLPAGDIAAIDAFAAAHGLMADVPEPASASLLLVAGMGMLARRRRSN